MTRNHDSPKRLRPAVAGALAALLLAGVARAQDVGNETTFPDTGTIGGSAATAAETPKARRYDSLSPGNKKIANVLFKNQKRSGGNAWSLDRIAEVKTDGRGWGDVFHLMKREGLTDARNLGELISGRYVPPELPPELPPEDATATGVATATAPAKTIGGSAAPTAVSAGGEKAPVARLPRKSASSEADTATTRMSVHRRYSNSGKHRTYATLRYGGRSDDRAGVGAGADRDRQVADNARHHASRSAGGFSYESGPETPAITISGAR